MWIKRLGIAALFLAFIVITLGAYTRLKDAGLGCPDWPGCYGHWSVPTTPETLEHASTHFPAQPVEAPKAWPEMIHRYFASALGLLILITAIISVKTRQHLSRSQVLLAVSLLALVICQGLLGKFTVTMRLDPIVVVAHLLGGFTTLSLLFLMTIRAYFPPTEPRKSALQSHALFGLICVPVLICQIALGGWTSANYAARICPELPVCSEQWLDTLDVGAAFQRPAQDYASFEHAPHLDAASKITIQMLHRGGALITTLLLGTLYLTVLFHQRHPRPTRRLATTALVLLAAQVGLGLLNVLLDLPLPIAVAHNGVAALSLLALLAVTYRLYYGENTTDEPSHYPTTSLTDAPHSMA